MFQKVQNRTCSIKPYPEAVGDTLHLGNPHNRANVISRISVVDFEVDWTKLFSRYNFRPLVHLAKRAFQLKVRLGKI